jgi:hypothetical protein
MCIYYMKCVNFKKYKLIKNWTNEKNYNYNVMWSGWIIMKSIKLICKYMFSKYPFYYLFIPKLNTKLKLIYDY